jgi:putative transposase
MSGINPSRSTLRSADCCWSQTSRRSALPDSVCCREFLAPASIVEPGRPNTLDNQFCLEALGEALGLTTPAIFNTDQGAQFTSGAYTKRLEEAGVRVSMDGRGLALDNVFVERLWRSVKHEEIYLKDYQSVPLAIEGLKNYFHFYNTLRPHQALGYRTPVAVYREGTPAA